MKHRNLLRAFAATMLIGCLTTMAQETGNWRATSSTARSITGDVGISSEKLFINFTRFTISRIRTLEPAEVSAAFDTDSNSGSTGSLYRLAIPADKKFLNKSTLCGSEQTQWMAAFATGGTLKLAFFSGATPPVFTLDAISNSTDLCGTFTYIR